MGEIKRRRKAERRKQWIRVLVPLIAVLLLAGVLIGVSLWKKDSIATDVPADGVGQPEVTDTEKTGEDSTQEAVAKEPFSMFFTGDIMLENSMSRYDAKGIGGILSEYLQQEMKAADMTVVNNEFPYSARGEKAPDKQFTFRVNPKYVSALQDMGVDVASLANNHALDFGQDALLDSFTTLDEAGIPYVGAGATKERAEEAIFVESDGRTVGVLSASRVIPVHTWNITSSQPGLFCTYDSTRLVERIQEIQDACDYVVVYVHWGIEREAYPEEYQRELAKQYIDAGADLVVGSHSHVPQGIEYYKGVPIIYCLGNYIFNPDMVDTYAVKVLWDWEDHTQVQVIPVGTSNLFTSELDAADTQAFYDYLEGISFGITIDENGMVSNTAE